MSESRNEDRERARSEGDALADEQRQGMDLLGRSSVRDDAIAGVSGLAGDPELRGSAPRRNPPQMDDVNNMAGDLSQSGGVAGGERGGFGSSDAGAGGPDETRGGPAQYKGTSRMDLDHPSTEIGGDANDARGHAQGPDER